MEICSIDLCQYINNWEYDKTFSRARDLFNNEYYY